MRRALRAELESIGASGTWNHITDQNGMFSFTGLSFKQCEILNKQLHVYMLKSGRISIGGINTKNVKYIAWAFKQAIARAPV